MSARDIESMISYKREAYDMKKVRCPFPCALAFLIALQLWLPLFVSTHPAAYAETAPEQPFQEQIEREIRLGNARSFLYDLENSVACAVPSAENERIG